MDGGFYLWCQVIPGRRFSLHFPFISPLCLIIANINGGDFVNIKYYESILIKNQIELCRVSFPAIVYHLRIFLASNYQFNLLDLTIILNTLFFTIKFGDKLYKLLKKEVKEQ